MILINHLPLSKKILSSIIAVSLIGACSQQDAPAESNNTSPQEVQQTVAQKSPQQQLQDLYIKANQTLFQARVFSATLFGLSAEQVGKNFFNSTEDYSPKNEQQLRADLLAISQQIAKVKLPPSATPSDHENQQVMASITRYFAGNPKFNVGFIHTWMGLSPFIVNQINGPLLDIPRIMQGDQPLLDENHAQNYITRLSKFAALIDSIQAKQKHDMEQGWIPPKVILKGALRYFDKFLAESPENHPLMTNFEEKVNLIDSLSENRKKELIGEALTQIKQTVYPAYQKIAEQTTALVSKAKDESGIWAQPNGAAYYQDAIKQLGDSELTAEQIHQIGLNEVARISAQMDKLLTAAGYTQGSVGQRMVELTEDPQFLYPDSEQGRAELLQDLNGYIEEMNEAMEPLFKSKPKYAVEVRAFPKEIQDGAPGGQYSPPSLDGSKPGVYWINLRDMKANPKFSLKTLTYHEANPGHHWQIALNLEQTSLPFLRRIAPYNAYIEGWALYSEQVAAEMGMYKNDPLSDLGRLQAELFRAVRLVVDTGLHHKRWTREQAIAYMAETTGSVESDVISEIERYMAWPGQALGYKLGMLKILELRETAKAALGENFDLAKFHDLVLLGGAVPMAVLSDKVNAWIESQKEIQTETSQATPSQS
ncbi:DUF885 domain-containing protein [Aliikangiella sp. IMCC44653]